MKQPARLLDDPAIAPELRSDLKRTASAEAAYDVGAGLVALQAAIVASAAAPATSAAAAKAAAAAKSATSAFSAKLAIAVLSTTAVIALTALVWPRHGSPAPHASTPERSTAEVARAPQPAPQAPAQAALPSAAASATQPEANAAAAAPHARPLATRALRDDDAELRREIAQLGRIKALVERDPNTAARLALQGDREFRRGMLREERAALAVVALWNAGRTGEATRRAQAFITRYPESPSRARIERLLHGEQE